MNNNTLAPTTNRKNWLDAVKGIGILLVVFAHIDKSFIRDFIYIFHMPLFYFISGYLFKPKPLISFLKSKSQGLLLPYVSYLVLLTTPIIIYETFFSGDGVLMYLNNALLGGNWLKGAYSVFWFITSLFATQQFYNYICVKFKANTINIIVTFFLVIAYTKMYLFESIQLILALDTIFMAVVWFHIGCKFKRFEFQFSKLLLSLFIACPLLLFWILPSYLLTDYKVTMYGFPFIGIFTALLIIIFIIHVCKDVDENNKPLKVFSYIGSFSMTIMFLHQPIQIFLYHHVMKIDSISLTIITVLICIIIHHLIARFLLLKRLFIGSN